MQATINTSVLKQIASHYRSLSVKYRLKGLPYERCAELSWVVDHLSPRFEERLQYLDIGTGESPLPSYLYAHSNWDVTCLDKFTWVRKQNGFSRKVDAASAPTRFRVVESDLLESALPAGSFDII